MLSTSMRIVSFSVLFVAVLALNGCGGAGVTAPTGNNAANPAADVCAVEGWCTEHGVPEDICAQCNPQVAAEYQKKGDWCKEHNRPESQCFLCNPALEAKFAADYEAKYGKKPPKPEGK
jgi:hypothetical protein